MRNLFGPAIAFHQNLFLFFFEEFFIIAIQLTLCPDKSRGNGIDMHKGRKLYSQVMGQRIQCRLGGIIIH